MKIKNFIATVMTFVFLTSTFIGCADNNDNNTTDTTNTTFDTTAADNGLDRVPDMNFDAYNFKVYSTSSDFFRGELTVEAENGEVLNDARYEYIRTVEERFNIDITEVTSLEVSDEPRVNIQSGDAAYDLINLYTSTAINYALEEMIYIIGDLPYIDLERPYWNHTINDELSICNESYFALAPFNLTVYDFSHALIFNKKIINDYNLENPYELVNDGKWTFDVFTAMTTDVTKDLNGDSKLDGDDAYGFLAQPKAVLPGFWTAAGEKTIKKGTDGELYFAAVGNENFASLIDRLFQITWDNETWFRNQSTTNYDPLLRNMFKNDQGLFFDTQVYYIEQLRDMETDFGIIPYPKYTEIQENYNTRVESLYLFTVPVTNTDLEMTSAVIEVLACEAAYTVIPAYYEIALKSKYTRDNDSIEMLDIIFNNLTIDFGDTVWCGEIRDGIFRLMFLDNKRDLASQLASIEESVGKLLTDTMQSYSELKNN